MSVQALNIALSGLKVAKQALDVTSNNIANAGVDGYTRKILPQYTNVGTGGTYFGVLAGNIQRNMDVALRRDVWAQTSKENYLMTRTNYLERIQTFHGASDAEQAISSAISDLENSFAQLSTSPEDIFLQNDVLNSASEVANTFNDFGDLITNTRNDAQNEMRAAVTSINELLENIASLNQAIKRDFNLDRSTAALEDERDIAIKELTKLVDISTYTRGDAVMVIQTRGGTILAEESAQELYFNPATLSAGTTGASIYLNDATGIDLTTTNLGGSLGALLELRDQTLPSYQAQADELAHKLSLRFASQGMVLFTDGSGAVPGLATADYIGYSSEIQVNPAILADTSLLRTGTEPSISVGEASSDVIQKILDFTFGDTEETTAAGTADLLAGPDLFTILGLSGTAQIAGTTDVAAMGVLSTDPDINPGDSFTLQVGGNPPQNIVIGAADDITALLATINGAMNPDLTATQGPDGQILFQATGDITISTNTISAAGLSALGFTAGTTTAQNPSFSVELSTGGVTEITIAPGDTAATLLAALNAIPELTASLGPGNILQLEPTYGGELRLVNVNGTPLTAMGMSYSQTAHVAMQSTGLGASGTLSTGITSTDFIAEYGRRMISAQAADYQDASRSYDLEGDYRGVLEQQLNNQFGVDIDQEMAALIEIQTNYSAAARVVQASRELFDELLNAI